MRSRLSIHAVKKILIVADDTFVATNYRDHLTNAGLQVQVAAESQMGLDLLRQFGPDAVLAGGAPPSASGLHWMRAIRTDARFHQLPILALLSSETAQAIQQAQDAGASRCGSRANCPPKMALDILQSLVSRVNGQIPAPSDLVSPAASSPVDRHHAPVSITAAAHAPLPPTVTAPQPFLDPTSAPLLITATDNQVQGGVDKSFFASLPSALSDLRGMLPGLVKAETEPARAKILQTLHLQIQGLTTNANPTGAVLFIRMAKALESLLKELHAKPGHVTSSSLRTIASAIDSLNQLAQLPATSDHHELFPPSILVVDDEPISRHAVTHALEKAKLRSVGVRSPLVACDLLADNRFDLIFLDISMPEMTGHELCARLRSMPAHKKTPVIFVTGLSDFDNRANSSRIGGTDFIAKPFLLSELAVKAVYHLLRAQMTGR